MANDTRPAGGAPAHTTADWPWAPIPEAVLYDHRLDPLAVRVYGCLLRHGLDPGACYPSHARIAELIGCSKRSINRPVRDLEENGWIERVPRFDDRGDRTSDGFHVRTQRDPSSAPANAPPALHSVDPPAPASAHPPRQPARRKESQLKESQLNEITPLALLAETEPAEKRSGADFDAFWAVVAVKVDKGAARKAWATAVRKVKPERLVEAQAAYARSRAGKDPRFTKRPRGWLEAEAWDNPLEPPGPDRQPQPKRATVREWAVDEDRSGPSGRLEL